MREEYNNILGRSLFGVCSYLGEKFGISTAKVRMYFIYFTCATLGSWVFVYLFLTFWVNVRKYFKRSNPTVWE